MSKKQMIMLGGVMAVAALVAVGFLHFLTRGTVSSTGFCDVCHTAYYDPAEYAFNEKSKMSKPTGVLTGCAECHPQPYAEFKASAHFETDFDDLRPGCANCHTPHTFFQWLQYMYYSTEAWERVQLSLHDNAFWEDEVRPALAAKARLGFVKDGSRFCKECHLGNNRFKADIKRHAAEIEVVKEVSRINCIKCHYNIVHAEVDWDDKDEMLKGH